MQITVPDSSYHLLIMYLPSTYHDRAENHDARSVIEHEFADRRADSGYALAYFWFLLLGLAGMVLSSAPESTSGLMYLLAA